MTKRKSTNTTLEFNNILVQLDDLTKRRVLWQDGVQRMATRELYEILAECHSLYRRILPNAPLKVKLSKILKSRNVTQTAGTSLQLKVVRYVFGECDQEYLYAKSIRVAHDQKPDSTSFADWLAEQGGPAGIKAKSGAKKKDAATLIEAATQHYESAPALSLQADAFRPNPDANHTYAVALVRTDAKDPTKREIVFGTSNIAVINTVLESAAKVLPLSSLKLRSFDDPNLDLHSFNIEAAE